MESLQFRTGVRYLRTITAILLIIAAAEGYQFYQAYTQSKQTAPTAKKIQELYAKGDFQELLRYSREILRNDPDDVFALFGAAESLYQLGNLTKAEELFRQVKEKAPHWSARIDPYFELIRQKRKETSSRIPQE
jgi:tetratricopeptide (TPR) repeat protein